MDRRDPVRTGREEEEERRMYWGRFEVGQRDHGKDLDVQKMS
jgi:hypothetical protein